jgi:predicted phosphatase
LTPCCGLEVQKPIQALMSVKGLGNTFDLNPKLARTLPLGIFHVVFIEPHPFKKKYSNIKVDI